ncbi:MAG: ParB N-terminal domain-containing protein, partial [Clostridia bacterium]|nr:ParB N-terminal domain-containing protein [Clostridia bacterium]
MYWGMKPEIAGAVKRVPAGRILRPDRGGDGEERTAAGSQSGREARKRREEAVRQAADGIRMKGEPEPVLVRRLLPSDGQLGSGIGDFDCVLVAGEIRVEAAELAGLGEIPCVYVDSAPDRGSEGSRLDGAAQAIVETVRREEIGLFECAAAIAALVERTGCTQEACAAMLGVSQ